MPDAFWRETVRLLLDLLRKEACIVTEDGELRCPSDIWLRPVGLSPNLLSTAELHAATGKDFVGPDVLAAQAKCLGCAELPDTELLRALSKVVGPISCQVIDSANRLTRRRSLRLGSSRSSSSFRLGSHL